MSISPRSGDWQTNMPAEVAAPDRVTIDTYKLSQLTTRVRYRKGANRAPTIVPKLTALAQPIL